MEIKVKVIKENPTNLIETRRELRTRNEARERETKVNEALHVGAKPGGDQGDGRRDA